MLELLYMLILMLAMQQQAEADALMANILKMESDATKAVISNLK